MLKTAPEFWFLLSAGSSDFTDLASQQAQRRKGQNALDGCVLSPRLGLFHGCAGRCRVPAEETTMGSNSLQRAAAGKDGGGDGSQHRFGATCLFVMWREAPVISRVVPYYFPCLCFIQ